MWRRPPACVAGGRPEVGISSHLLRSAARSRRLLHGREEVSPIKYPQDNVLDFPRDLPVIIESGGKVNHPFEGRTEAGGRPRFTSAAALPIHSASFQRCRSLRAAPIAPTVRARRLRGLRDNL